MQNPIHRWSSVEYLRAIAAIAVAGFHFEPHMNIVLGRQPDAAGIMEWFGFAGVDLFFIISGFVVWPAAWQHDNDKRDNISFLIRRLVRVYIPYWFAVLFACAMHLAPPTANLIKSVLLFPQPIATQALPIAWTLVIEIIFYTTVFGLLFLPQKIRFTALCAIAAIAFLGNAIPALMGVFSSTQVSRAWSWVPTIGWFDAVFVKYIFSLNFLEFVIGACLANSLKRGGLARLAQHYSTLWFIALAWFFGALFIAVFWIGRIGILDSGMILLKSMALMVGATLFFTAAVCTDIYYRSQPAAVSSGTAVGTLLTWLGSGSYMIYLLHTVVFGIAANSGLRAWCAAAGIYGAIVFLLFFIASIGVASWIGNRIELPLYRRLISLIFSPARRAPTRPLPDRA